MLFQVHGIRCQLLLVCEYFIPGPQAVAVLAWREGRAAVLWMPAMGEAWVWGLEDFELCFQHFGEEIRVLSSPARDGQIEAPGGDVIRLVHAHHSIGVGDPVPIPTGHHGVLRPLLPEVGVVHVVEGEEDRVVDTPPLHGVQPTSVHEVPCHHHVCVAEEGEVIIIQVGEAQV